MTFPQAVFFLCFLIIAQLTFDDDPNTKLFFLSTHLHHAMKLDTLSRAKNVPLLAAGKKCTELMARIGPASPVVMDFVIDF
jgi:hypothetical protein